MKDYRCVKTLSKDRNKTTELFLLKEEQGTRYFVINFVGFRVENEMEICQKTYKELLRD